MKSNAARPGNRERSTIHEKARLSKSVSDGVRIARREVFHSAVSTSSQGSEK